MPTRGGPLTPYYPKWIPGEHEPSGPVGNVVLDSIRGGLAFQAGILSGMRIVAINDRAFTTDRLHDVLKASKTSPQSIRFLLMNNDYYSTHTIDYQRGEKYPHLVRAEGKPDLLDKLSKPLACPSESEHVTR